MTLSKLLTLITYFWLVNSNLTLLTTSLASNTMKINARRPWSSTKRRKPWQIVVAKLWNLRQNSTRQQHPWALTGSERSGETSRPSWFIRRRAIKSMRRPGLIYRPTRYSIICLMVTPWETCTQNWWLPKMQSPSRCSRSVASSRRSSTRDPRGLSALSMLKNLKKMTKIPKMKTKIQPWSRKRKSKRRFSTTWTSLLCWPSERLRSPPLSGLHSPLLKSLSRTSSS